jgi:hypothetical protein
VRYLRQQRLDLLTEYDAGIPIIIGSGLAASTFSMLRAVWPATADFAAKEAALHILIT